VKISQHQRQQGFAAASIIHPSTPIPFIHPISSPSPSVTKQIQEAGTRHLYLCDSFTTTIAHCSSCTNLIARHPNLHCCLAVSLRNCIGDTGWLHCGTTERSLVTLPRATWSEMTRLVGPFASSGMSKVLAATMTNAMEVLSPPFQK
jgi:hypothetical protein